MAMLTKKQKVVYDFIKDHINKKGFAPTFGEIGKHFKFSTLSTVSQYIETLEEKGFLTKSDYSARGIELAGIEQMIQVPLLGTIAAGEPLTLFDVPKEYIAVPKNKIPASGDIYALRVTGSSMIDDGVDDGDTILVRHQSTAENGQKVVALIEDRGATLKRFYKEKSGIRLQPANKRMEPIILDKKIPVEIQGIMLGVVKNQETTTAKEKDSNTPNKLPNQPISSKHKLKIAHAPTKNANVVLFEGDRLDLMRQLPDKSVKLIVTSPPYNIGKEYEKRTSLDIYLAEQEKTFKEAVRILTDDGSICWQVGNHIAKDGEIFPLDALIYQIGKKIDLKLRNRIIWRFGHGLHCTKRFSGRHETIVWFTKSDNYTFNLDPVRIPQKYPGKKNFKKNEKYGTLSGNPLGKNPEDVWDIPNVKNNHPEKTEHPCQFPIELIERLVLSMTNPGDAVLDPYLGVGSTICAAIIHDRKGYGSDIMKEYLNIAEKRIKAAANGTLRRRLMGTPIYQPTNKVGLAELPTEFKKARESLFGARG